MLQGSVDGPTISRGDSSAGYRGICLSDAKFQTRDFLTGIPIKSAFRFGRFLFVYDPFLTVLSDVKILLAETLSSKSFQQLWVFFTNIRDFQGCFEIRVQK